MVVEERFASIERQLDQLGDELERLAVMVRGRGDEIQPGIVGVLARNSTTIGAQGERLRSVERTIDRFRWTVLGWTAAGSVFGGVIVTLVLQLTEHGTSGVGS